LIDGGVVAHFQTHQQVRIVGLGEKLAQGAQNLRQGLRAPLGRSPGRCRHLCQSTPIARVGHLGHPQLDILALQLAVRGRAWPGTRY
jgi:hypothetical protein